MTKYILDTNVYIQAHIGYYHHDIAPSYWDVLKGFGDRGLIVSPKQVRDEITSKDEWLSTWKRNNKVFLDSDLTDIMIYLNQVRNKYKEVYDSNFALLRRKYTSRYIPSRDKPLSDPDMFVIATALFYKAKFPSMDIVLVTKENDNITPFKSVRIPHVSRALDIRCIDDFQFLKEVGVKFEATCP